MLTESRVALPKTADRGGVAEWLKAPVLKTGFPKGNVGSNPTPSATQSPDHIEIHVAGACAVRAPGPRREVLY